MCSLLSLAGGLQTAKSGLFSGCFAGDYAHGRPNSLATEMQLYLANHH